jgi:hypothetical protein
MNADDAIDALDRLRDERQQIEELFDTFLRHRRDPQHQPAEAARLSQLIVTLLRVHAALEGTVLQPALVRELGMHPVLARVAACRAAVSEAIERVEETPVRDPGYGREMAMLRQHVREWFEVESQDLATLARASPLDLAKLDRELATRQEAMLSAPG